MISRWIYNLIYGKPQHMNLLTSFALSFGAIAAGYTITNFPYRILKFFEKPWLQFMVFFALSFSSYYSLDDESYNILHVFFDAIVYTAILQLIKRLADKTNTYLEENQPVRRKPIKELNIRYDKDGALVSGFLPSDEHSLRWQWVGNYLQVWAVRDDFAISPTPNEPFTLYIKRNVSKSHN